MPTFLAGCGLQSALPTAEKAPANPFMEWFSIDETVVQRLMSTLSSNGADIADLYFQHTRNNSLTFENGVISQSNLDIQQGLGLRVIVGDQTGYAFTEDLTLPSMIAAATNAAAKVNGTQSILPNQFVPQALGDLYTTSATWQADSTDEILPILQFVEAQVRAGDPAIEKVAVYWEDSADKIMIATLNGRLVMDDRPMARLTVVATARKGEEVQTGYSNIAARGELSWFSEARLGQTIKEAVDRTMIQFEVRRAPTGEMPVVLASGSSGVLLHEAIGHAMEADFNLDGSSPYSDKIGEKVAEPFVTIVDQADLPGERGALNYDDEGNRAGRTVMVENGVLKSYLHDQVSARQFGIAASSSGRRESYRHPPMPRMTCTFMEDGPHEHEEIISAVADGIYCETYTDGHVELGAGDYSFTVKNGWLIEKGRITAPIKDVSIIGNGPETLGRITMVANDAKLDAGGWTCGKNGQRVPVSQGVPTILVSEMTVASDANS